MDSFVPSLKRSCGIIIIALLLAGALCLPPVFAATASSAQGDSAPGEVIVVFEDNKAGQAASSDTALEQLEEEHAVVASEEITENVGEDGKCVLMTLEEDADAEAAASELSDLPGVAYAQPNYRYQLFSSDEADAYLDRQYSLNPWNPDFPSDQDLGANITAAWDLLGGICKVSDATVTIAVLDTGCQLTHEDLRGTVLADLAYDSVTEKQGPDATPDTDGHGTHVAGIAAGEIGNGVGIAGAAGNYARFIPINIFRTDGAYTEDMLVAFHYLDQLMTAGEISPLHVINMSIGRYGDLDNSDYALESCIATMREKGVLTVCAGGNGDGTNAYQDKFSFPGDFDECLAVTALDKQGNNAGFSDYSMKKDISAPGSKLLSTSINNTDPYALDDDQDYTERSGTSMSAPLVSGIAALLWADNAELSVDQVVKALLETAHPVNTEKYDRTGLTGSAGAVDAAAALAYAREHKDDPPEEPDDPIVDPDEPPVPEVINEGAVSLKKPRLVYNGKNRSSNIVVTDRKSGKALIKETDYTISCATNMKSIGKHNYTVTFKGSYKNTSPFKDCFYILPAKAVIKSAKPGKKRLTVKLKAQAGGVKYKVAYRIKGKSWKTKTTTKPSLVIKKLKSKKKYQIRVRAYKVVGWDTYYGAWSKIKTLKIK